MARISREARLEIVGAVSERYQASNKSDKTIILDEFVRLTGYQRKHAVRVLRGQAAVQKALAVSRPCVYNRPPSPRRALGGVRSDLRQTAPATPAAADHVP